MIRLLITFALLCLLTAPSIAVELPCGPAEKGTISLDGMAEDWQDVPAAQGGDDRARVSLKCNVEGKTLYLAIEASDEYVVRTKQARAGEDHVELTLGGKRYLLFPAAGSVKAEARPSPGRVASTSSRRGFVIELAIPFAKAGLGRNPERLPFSLRFDDCDSAAALKTERSATVEGELAFTAGPSTLDSFLEEHRLARSSVRWQRPVRVGAQTVQLVLAGKYVAALSDGYGYMELPVADGKDVQSPELVDLAGDGRLAVLLRYTERGGEGSREVLAAFRPVGNEVRRVFAAEVGKRTPAGRLSTKVTLKKRGRATDILLEAKPAEGLTAETYNEAPATDVVPILLPWTEDKRATYTFSGDEYKRK